MCGRYTVLTEDEIIEIRAMLKTITSRLVNDNYEYFEQRRQEVTRTNFAPVILQDEQGISFESVKWGFRHWEGKGEIINARCETITTRATFAPHAFTHRCVIPAREFFEYKKNGRKRLKHSVTDKDGNLLYMAGLYREVNGQKEFVIITKAASGDMVKVHDRMPVILRPDQIEDWFNDIITPEELYKLEFDVSVLEVEKLSDAQGVTQLSLFPEEYE